MKINKFKLKSHKLLFICMIFGMLLSMDIRTALAEDDKQGGSIDVGQAFIAAYESNNQTEMIKLVKENKNSISKELVNIISYATSGEVTTEEMIWLIRVSEKMGGIYSSEFSDKRLENFVANYKKWTRNEQEKKKEADIIFHSYKKDLKNKDYDAVVEKWDKSLEIYEQIGDRLGEAKHLDEIGIAFGKLGSFKTSIKYLNDARQINNEIGNGLGEISSLRYIATGYIALEDYTNAIASYKSALNIARELGDNPQGDALQTEIESIENKLKNAKAESK